MKTIILCGGRGIRLNEETEFRPKPMVTIGNYPILLHIMNIYAYYGHKDFILCLGYKGDIIKDYFLNLSRYTDDIEFDMKTGKVRNLARNIEYDYKITFVETGDDTLTSERLIKGLRYVSAEDEYFMVTYGDGLSTVNVNDLIKFHKDQEISYGTCATVTAVHPHSKYGKLSFDERNIVTSFEEKQPILGDYINGGFHVYNKKAIDFLRENEMLEDSLIRMSNANKLSLYKYDGFWHCMDTMKDYKSLNELWETTRPWALWEKDGKKVKKTRSSHGSVSGF